MNGLIGRKLGMTRIFAEDGTAIPVTVLEAGPCPVLRVDHDAKVAQLGFGARKEKRSTKALAGHVAASGVTAVPRVIKEFTISGSGEVPSPGDEVGVSVFAEGDIVKIAGTTKGRGFQGVVKRYGFRGGPATHGSTRHRSPGSMGPGTDPSRVIKGKKLPGHMGAKQKTALGLQVVRIDSERNLLFIRGAVPGPRNGLVYIRKQEGRSRYV